MRNRIYHIKKEVKYLKRLKRILIQRLVLHRDQFVEPCLEIPDCDPGNSGDAVENVDSFILSQKFSKFSFLVNSLTKFCR